MDVIRPLKHLHAAGKVYPAAWKQVEIFRSDKGKGLPDWPSWCFMPLAAWYSIVSSDAGVDRITDLNLIQDVSRLAAIGTWRYSQGIYRFDSELFSAVSTTELLGDLPADVLYRLPEWSIYIETPGLTWAGSDMYGFWCHLESDANDGRSELRLLLDTNTALIPVPIHIGDWPLLGAVTRAINEAGRQAMLTRKVPLLRPVDADKLFAKQLMPLVSLILYICSDEPDITGPGSSKPRRPEPVRTKAGWRMFPADKPTIWMVGERVGDLLRQSAAEGGGEKAAHIRRAHWHGYWYGPADKRRFKYNWLSPMVVGGKKDQS